MTEPRRAKLSERQRVFLQISAYGEAREPGPVRLMSAADWRTARSLVRAELGAIEKEAGEQARFIANATGATIVYSGRDARPRRR